MSIACYRQPIVLYLEATKTFVASCEPTAKSNGALRACGGAVGICGVGFVCRRAQLSYWTTSVRAAVEVVEPDVAVTVIG
jgi:hypothetical protein